LLMDSPGATIAYKRPSDHLGAAGSDMQSINAVGSRWLFKMLVVGAIVRIVVATGCTDGDREQGEDMLQLEADVTSSEEQAVAAEDDSAPVWTSESLVRFRLPLEAANSRQRPSPWPTSPEVIASVLEHETWDQLRPVVVQLYRSLGFRPIFTGSEQSRRQGLELLKWLTASSELGLDPASLGIPRLVEMLSPGCKVEGAAVFGGVPHDSLLSNWSRATPPSALELVCNADWIAPDRELDIDIRITAAALAALGALQGSGGSGSFRWEGPDGLLPAILTMLPRDELYWSRVAALRRLTHPALAWKSDKVDRWSRLKPGVAGPRVEELHVKLFEMGYLATLPTGRAARVYGPETGEAVARFRSAHGLPPGDQVDGAAQEILQLKREQMAMLVWQSLNRSIAMNEHGEQSYLLVNVAAAELLVVNKGRIEARHRVVVGKLPKRGEGLTADSYERLAGVTVNPEYVVSEEELKRDVLPKARRKSALAELGYEKVGDTWIRLPGPGNPLGPVALELVEPASQAIHGSYNQRIFGKQKRAVTDGEVMVDGIEALAARLLTWAGLEGGSVVGEALGSGETVSVTFPETVAVHVVYDRVLMNEAMDAAIGPDPYRMAKRADKDQIRSYRNFIRRLFPE